ncbi:MAG: hypothetical protein IRZ16_19245 [Myxococcaceae bacterium]|nr:hypothetical protein [Myxococcaceae bacterium]
MGQPKLKDKPEVTAAPPRAEVATVPLGDPLPAERPQTLTRVGWIFLGVVILTFQIPLIARWLRPAQPVVVSIPYTDDFSDPSTVQKNYWTTGGHWRVANGELLSPGVKNNPLWLEARLPRDVAVEFDVRSESPEGDIKVEIFGDGLNHASGYVLIHGGWSNRLSIIARLDEHGASLTELQRRAQARAKELGLQTTGLVETGVFRKDTRMRVEANPYPVQIGRTYHWRIERRGALLRWFIDGQPFMEFEDPFPLGGEGHDRFGFSSWESYLYFDNLRIEPL